MDQAIFVNALRLILSVTWPFVAAAIAGAVVAGIIRLVTHIDDVVVSFTGKITAVGLLLFYYGPHSFQQVLSFTQRLWGGADFF